MAQTTAYFANYPENYLFTIMLPFNRSPQNGKFSDNWKRLHMSSIAKGGDRASPSNYRPISLLCTPEKCLNELCLNTYTTTYMKIKYYNLVSYVVTLQSISLHFL